MSIDSHEPQTTEQVDQARIDRRTAMKAALGGAVAAAAWSAPKIEGLSLSPDYASAGSRTTVNATLVNNHAAQSASGSTYECVGQHNGGVFGSCSDLSFAEVAIPVPTTTEVFRLNTVLGGQVKNNGFANVSMSGITNSDYSCAVNLSGNCTEDNGNTYGGNLGNLNGTGTFTLTTSTPTANRGVTCNGNLSYMVSHVTINVACTYGTI